MVVGIRCSIFKLTNHHLKNILICYQACGIDVEDVGMCGVISEFIDVTWLIQGHERRFGTSIVAVLSCVINKGTRYVHVDTYNSRFEDHMTTQQAFV